MEEEKGISQTNQQLSPDYTDNDVTVDSKNPSVDNEFFSLRKRKSSVSNYIVLVVALILVFWLVVYLSPQHRSYNGKTISITRGSACKSDSSKALDLLEEKDPEHYQLVFKYIGTIKCVSQGSAMMAYEKSPTFLLGDKTREQGVIWLAGVFAHEATHSKLYLDYLAQHSDRKVPDDIWTGQNAEIQCLNIQYNTLQKIGADQKTLDWVKNSVSTNYWDTPYSQRSW